MSQVTFKAPDNVISLYAVKTKRQSVVDQKQREDIIGVLEELLHYAQQGELAGLAFCTDGTAVGQRAGAVGTLREPSALALATAKMQKFLWTFVTH